AVLDQGLLVVLGDATGHGIGPALSVTQMHAMLRMAFRLGADLETAFLQVNNQLAATISDDRFIQPSLASSTSRRIGYGFIAAARRRSCITAPCPASANATTRRASRWLRCRSPDCGRPSAST